MEPQKDGSGNDGSGNAKDIRPKAASAQGACDHFQPSDLTGLAETHLLEKSLPAERWEGSRFGYGAGGGSGPFKAVYMEVERRNGGWVVVKLDRLKTELAPADAGFKVIRDGA